MKKIQIEVLINQTWDYSKVVKNKDFFFRVTYQVVVSFDPKEIEPRDIHFYNHWEKLNRFYGVLNINRELAPELKAIIEFQPGYYDHIQMRAIRDEYTKLPGIRFGWVMGKTAVQVS